MTTDQLEESLTAALQAEVAMPATSRLRVRESMYWRIWKENPSHSRHNWISVGPAMTGPATAIEYTEFIIRKQAEPLKKYGTYDGFFDRAKGIDRSEIFTNGKRFNPILRQDGGILEFPKSQVVALNWHRNPAIAAMCPAEFKLDELESFVCEIDNKVFNSAAELKKYVRAMYPETASSAALGVEVGKAIDRVGASDGTTLTMQDLLEVIKVSNADNALMMAEIVAKAVMPSVETETE